MESPYFIYGQRKTRESVVELSAPEFAASAVILPPLPTIVGATMVTPSHPDYAAFLPVHNKRNYLNPSVQPVLRMVCTSTAAVVACVNWVRNNNLPFSLRSGGHCYEAFSNGGGVVIDLRKMGLVTVDSANKTVMVSAGATLGKVYNKVAAAGFAFAAGSCPTVGVSGHTLGGGFGFISRRYGLCCDNLLSVRFVTAAGVELIADETNNPDIYWACRGGGGGSFGVATQFKFKIHNQAKVYNFGATWTFASNNAARMTLAKSLFDKWQNWAPMAPNDITALMKVSSFENTAGGTRYLRLRLDGKSTGGLAALNAQLTNLTNVVAPNSGAGNALSVVQKTFFESVGSPSGTAVLPLTYMDAKSDIVTAPLPSAAISALFSAILAIPPSVVIAICDAYGGAISQLTPTQTAFVHRGSKTYSIQYYASWSTAAATSSRIANLQSVHSAMQPFMTGASYVNYCDLDLGTGYANAYWGINVSRLHQIKTAIDPANLFHHGQSVQ